MSQPVYKSWINIADRRDPAYKAGVQEFMRLAKENNTGLTTCPCPCRKCQNRKRGSFEEVDRHLFVHGINQSDHFWVLHGENPRQNVMEQPFVDNNENIVDEENIGNNGLGMGNFVDACYEVHEPIVGECSRGDHDDSGNIEEPHVLEPNLDKRYIEYQRKAKEKLYPSSEGPETTLSAIVELHNMKKQFGWSGNSVTALLGMLKRWLPEVNTLPPKYPMMKAMLKDLGMKTKCIDACENNCILYWKEFESAIECPQCTNPRYKVKERTSKRVGKKESNEAKKVLRYFPLIPRLKRLYSIPWIAREMRWHNLASPSWDYMRHPVDSSQWRLIKEKWPSFAKEGRNIWLGMATDGFNPRGIQSTAYSCWPVFVVPYNLPPSLCMKAEFQIMALLIPGPKAPGKDIDVFLQPLVDELKELWEGVVAYDSYRKEGFILKAMLMWGIHDFPAYGNLSGCVTHGYKACPVCGDETPSIYLKNSHKTVYTNYTRFLSIDHPFRDGRFLGQKTVETRLPPKPLNGQALLQQLNRLKFIPGKATKGPTKSRNRALEIPENDDDSDDGSGEVTEAYYKKSILFDLEYWADHQVRHVIDVMHTEKCFAEHLFHTILEKGSKTKDTINSRVDMKQMGIHRSQWLQEDASGKIIKPAAPFHLSKEEKTHFCKILKDLKLPTGFSSNLSNIVNIHPPELLTMKSHDYHVIMQYLLPVLVQHAYPKHRDLRRAIQQMSLFFNLLCSKVVVRKDIQRAKYMLSEAMCVFEKYFPPSFFDITVHLTVHLADEALICGPVGPRWMYPFERSMKDLKSIPSNKRYVEGSIAESYLVSESVKYAMEYMPNPRDGNHKATHEAFLDENSEYSDEMALLDGKNVTLQPEQFVQIRRWVLFRLEVEGRENYYSEYLKETNPTHGKGKGRAKTEVEVQTEFIAWLYNELLEKGETNSMLWRLVQGPLHQVKTYRKYRANGFVFAPKYHDATVVTQDSGVCVKALTTYRSSSKDKNPIDVSTMWYGVIQQIMELDYTDFKEVVFYCDWVRMEDNTNGCKLCPDSNLVMVNFNKPKSVSDFHDEPVILASEASQVFYSKDLKNPDWWVVIHSPKRLTSAVDDLAVPTDIKSILIDQPNLEPLLQLRKR